MSEKYGKKILNIIHRRTGFRKRLLEGIGTTLFLLVPRTCLILINSNIHANGVAHVRGGHVSNVQCAKHCGAPCSLLAPRTPDCSNSWVAVFEGLACADLTSEEGNYHRSVAHGQCNRHLYGTKLCNILVEGHCNLGCYAQ